MKIPLPVLLLALSAGQLNGASSADLEGLLAAKYEDRDFGRFLGLLPYSTTFGLAIWTSPDATLRERAFPGGYRIENTGRFDAGSPAGSSFLERAEGWITREVGEQLPGEEEIKSELAAENLLWVSDYVKLGFNRQLRFKGNRGSAVLFRLRDKFQMLNEETGAASFVYMNDREADKSGSQFSGAAMLDFYLDSLYNRQWIESPRFIENPYRFWFRLGVEADYNSIDASNPTDILRQYALLTFQANPDQDARLFGIPWLPVTSPQIVQAGAVYEDNRVSGDDSLRWILGWEPRLVLNRGWFASTLGRGFALNNRMYYKKDSFGELATQASGQDAIAPAAESERIESQRSHIFSFINPHFAVEGASDARVNLPAFPANPTYTSLKALTDEVVTYQLALGLGFDFRNSIASATKASATFSYVLKGIQPVDDLGDGHLWHELRAEFNLTQMFPGEENKVPGTNDWAGLTAYVSWQKGDVPPSYQESDLLMAGISARF